MDMKRQINMCPLMPMVFILIQIKFDIDTNNDELLETIPKHKKERKKLIITRSVWQHGAQIERKKLIITSTVQQHGAQIGIIISVEDAKVLLGYVYKYELSFTLFKTWTSSRLLLCHYIALIEPCSMCVFVVGETGKGREKVKEFRSNKLFQRRREGRERER